MNQLTPNVAVKDAATTKTVAPSQIAHIELLPSRFEIQGPGKLIVDTNTIIRSMPDAEPELIKYHVLDLWADWYVCCSVSGEWISLAELKYWDVKTQAVYARPELVPVPGEYYRGNKNDE